MESRKIQTVGGGTYTVSLPKEWAEKQGVTAGDRVDVHTHIDGLLVVQARESEDDGPTRVAVTVDHDDAAPLERTLRAAYAAGSKELTFEATDGFTAEQRRTVEGVARTLTGASIVGESETTLTVRTMLDAGEVSVRQSVRQLAFAALSQHREATAALAGDGTVERRDDRTAHADRLSALVDRSVSRGLERLDEMDALGLTRPALLELWLTARELQRVADEAEGLRTLAAVGDDVSTGADDVRECARMARDVIEDAVGAVVEGADAGTIRRILDDCDRTVRTVRRRRDDLPDEAERAALALDRVRRTAERGGTIAEAGLRQAVRRGDLGAGSDLATDGASGRASRGPSPAGTEE